VSQALEDGGNWSEVASPRGKWLAAHPPYSGKDFLHDTIASGHSELRLMPCITNISKGNAIAAENVMLEKVMKGPHGLADAINKLTDPAVAYVETTSTGKNLSHVRVTSVE